MNRNMNLNGGNIAALIAMAVLVVIFLPGWFTKVNIHPSLSANSYEIAWYLLKATFSPFLLLLPLIFVAGFWAGSFFIKGGHKDRHIRLWFNFMSSMAQLPSAFFVFIIFILIKKNLKLDFEDALFWVYCLILLPRFTTATAIILRQLRYDLYETGIAFGASEIRSLVQLIWPSALLPLLAQLLRTAVLVSLEVTPVVLLFFFYPQVPDIRPVGAELFLQVEWLSDISLVSYIVTILAYLLLIYGISHALKSRSELKIPGEYDAR